MNLELAFTDLMTLWGVAKTTEFAGSVLGDIAKDYAKDKSKNFFKDFFSSNPDEAQQKTLLEALGKALRSLVQPFEDELLDNGYSEAQAKELIPQIKQFIDSREVKTAIRLAFTSSDTPVDSSLLAD